MCKMALNLDTKPLPGIGNVLMMCSIYYKWCQLNSANPIIYSNNSDKIVGIKKDLFEFTDEVPETFIDTPCTLHNLIRTTTCGYMHKVADLPDVELPSDIQAGFSFRFGDAKFDDGFTFMNEEGSRAMLELVKKYKRVFVCSNKNEFIKSLKDTFGHEKIFEVNDSGDDERFKSSHLKQWVLLSKCPVVYHSVRTKDGGAKELTSTFAPTAAVYGGCELIGLDNKGGVFYGNTYYW